MVNLDVSESTNHRGVEIKFDFDIKNAWQGDNK
jgi:hypothetical protein